MGKEYYYEFKPLKTFSLDITKEKSWKILEAVLHIELSSGVRHNLTLESPKVPSEPSSTLRDLFNDLTTKFVDSLKVFGEQYEPSHRDSDVLWRIEFWRDAGIKSPTIHCRRIQGLPKEGCR
jgi:hypothetical protein